MNLVPYFWLFELIAYGFFLWCSLLSHAVSGCGIRALPSEWPLALVFVISFVAVSGIVFALLCVPVGVICRDCRVQLFLYFGLVWLLSGNRACQLCF